MTAISDTTLVVALARYQQQALGEVYRRHAGSVFGLAKRLLIDQAKAEEVFLRLWNQPERFDPDRGSLRSFLLAQTHSRSVDVPRADSSRRRREERDARQAASGGRAVVHRRCGGGSRRLRHDHGAGRQLAAAHRCGSRCGPLGS